MPSPTDIQPANSPVRDYWNAHIHDLEITRHPVGSEGFFRDLDDYHFEKLHHLLRLVPFEAYRGKQVLDVGCGAGTDLVRFAKAGAIVTGLDIAPSAIDLARGNARLSGIEADLRVGDGEAMPFTDDSFDLVFAHGVVQYTSNDRRLVQECRRVLRTGGGAIFQVYNRVSWLNALSKIMRVPLEHEDAPFIRSYSARELRSLLGAFREVRLVTERFPVRSRLHGGWKGTVYNSVFVGTFNALPRALTRRFGWHLLAFCRK